MKNIFGAIAKTVDWAEWDDTYQFMADHNKAYQKSNLIADTLVSMQVDLIMYLDTQGRIFEAVPVKRLPGILPPVPEQVRKELLPVLQQAKSQKKGNGAVQGLVSGGAFPLIAAARPILTSTGKGPMRGWLVSVRYLHTGELKGLAQRTRLNLEAFVLGDPRTPLICQSAKADIKGDQPFSVRPLDNQTVASWTQMKDIHHRPLLTLYVREPRHLFQQGQQQIRYLVGVLVIATLVFSGVIFLILDRSFLRRVANLSHQVEQIGDEGSSLSRICLSGNDELTFLVKKMNRMLDTLAENARLLQENEEYLRGHSENLEGIVEERTRQIEHQALHDTLTNLPNRSLFKDRLELARSRANRSGSGVAVLFLDLDNFKVINDGLGHEAGDGLLASIAMQLKDCVRAGDTVARLGGDEFTVLLEDIHSEADAIEVAKKIVQTIYSPVILPQGQVVISGSLGIAYSADASETSDMLMHNADMAMYHAKTNGKNSFVCFDPSMHDLALERLEMENSLRRALDQNELRVHYQPIMDLVTGHISGVEALVRWQHPKKGLIAPGKFIPLAEETGLVVPLGYWVLEESCRQMMAWQESHPDHSHFTISVNLSGKQLERPDVVAQVAEVLNRTRLNPNCLKLEITETVLMENIEETIAKLHGLKALGLKLAIDDFGTGYSSMASLANFPVDTVKIDRAFVSRLCDQEESGAIVAAIIMLAKTLNMDVTGEGIETEGQVLQLQSLGCNTGQGYLFSRPLSNSDFKEKMMEGQSDFIPTPVDMDREMVEQLLAHFSPEELKRAA